VTCLACLSGSRAAEWIARTNKVWVLYLSTTGALDLTSQESPVPFLTTDQRLELSFGSLLLIFDNQQEALDLFNQVVGDDGPRPSNPYAGRQRVYAFVAGPQGGITENT
jgi:hypothetical protein